MKKLLLLLVALSLSLAVTAQEHLSFKGIPIEGNISTFCQKLQQKGFNPTGQKDNMRLFRGDFTGCMTTVGVTAANNGQEVFSVSVFFDKSESWNTLIDTYNHYKSLYATKYGAPKECIENNPSRNNANVFLMRALNQGQVQYTSFFEAPGGQIQISIENCIGVKYEGFVLIRYRDAQNIQSKLREDLEDI